MASILAFFNNFVKGFSKNVTIKLMIKKKGGKYVVLSESTGRSFGTYKTLKEAKKRLQQMEMFKHLKKKRRVT